MYLIYNTTKDRYEYHIYKTLNGAKEAIQSWNYTNPVITHLEIHKVVVEKKLLPQTRITLVEEKSTDWV